MGNLTQALEQRFATLFSGRRRGLARPLWRRLARLNRLDAIERLWLGCRHLSGFAFVDALLRALDCRYLIDQIERERIPEQGRCLIVANHPLGLLDALVLLHAVGGVRRDLVIVANQALQMIDNLDSLLLPVRVFEGDATAASGLAGMAAIERALAAEQAVIVLPAGEISRLGWAGIRDRGWQRGFVRLAERSTAPLLPMHVSGRNSSAFYALSLLAKPLGLALLGRELMTPGRRLQLRVGDPILASALRKPGRSAAAAAQCMHSAVYALAAGRDQLPGRLPAIRHAPALRPMLAEVQQLRLLGNTPDGKQIRCGRLDGDSLLLQEIARLREFTFRAVGEGSGRAADLDRFDRHYQQLLLWDPELLEVVGAYRIADCRAVLAEHGPSGLYTLGLFDLGAAERAHLDAAMELGRSFVQPKYWGSRSLDYLWIGIGAWLRAHPHVRHLFGAVSISAALPLPAREWLVAYYARYYGSGPGTSARRPFSFSAAPPAFDDLDPDAGMRLLKDNLAALGARVPTLYKQYTELCEPGGARFLAFGVDPDFADSLDGLIWVDLDRVSPKKRQRYLSAGAGSNAASRAVAA